MLNDDDIKKIASVLQSTFEDKIESIVNKITEGVVTNINAKLDHMQTEIHELRLENTELKTRVANLEKAQDNAEQYSRRNNLRISDIKEEEDESTDDIVMKMAEKIKANISLAEIDRSHRVGKPEVGKTRDIIVKMATYRSRQKLMKQRKLCKDSGYKNVFINEDLTRVRSNLCYLARCLVKDKSLKGAWTSDGTVLAKDNTDIVHRIKCVEDLNPFKRM